MLIEQLLSEGHDGGDLNLTDLDGLYRRARARFETDTDFTEKSRTRVVALQSGDPETIAIWHRLVAVSLAAFNETYARRGALLTDADGPAKAATTTPWPAWWTTSPTPGS
jgi:arginyl-tRNA synthetase